MVEHTHEGVAQVVNQSDTRPMLQQGQHGVACCNDMQASMMERRQRVAASKKGTGWPLKIILTGDLCLRDPTPDAPMKPMPPVTKMWVPCNDILNCLVAGWCEESACNRNASGLQLRIYWAGSNSKVDGTTMQRLRAQGVKNLRQNAGQPKRYCRSPRSLCLPCFLLSLFPTTVISC
jgi:hypothetical protein